MNNGRVMVKINLLRFVVLDQSHGLLLRSEQGSLASENQLGLSRGQAQVGQQRLTQVKLRHLDCMLFFLCRAQNTLVQKEEELAHVKRLYCAAVKEKQKLAHEAEVCR